MIRTLNTVALLVLFSALIVLVGCSDQNETKASGTGVTAGDVKEEVKEAAEVTAEYTEQQKEEYLERIQAQINALDQELNKLQSRVESKSDKLEKKAQEAFDRTMADLRHQKQEMVDNLEKMKDASGQAWSDIKSGLDAAVEKLSAAIDQAVSRFAS